MAKISKVYLPLLVVICFIIATIGYGTVKEQIKVSEGASEITPKGGDYLGEGVVLARFIWEDFYEAQFFPAKILTEASDKTQGEYEVMSLRGSPDIAKGAKIWTKDVILKSHPAKKEELKVGMVILYARFSGDVAMDEKELKEAIWRRGVILSLDKLYKNIIVIKALNRRTEEIHLKNTRISDDPLIEAPKEE